MGRTLLAAAKANPIYLQGDTNETPRVVLRLTRLDTSPFKENGESNDPRIAQTVQCLLDMGVEVELGERSDEEVHMSIPKPTPPSPVPVVLTPTAHINLDLSVIIALVSDLTHAPLPKTIEEANARFVPPPERHREWRQHRKEKQPGVADPPEIDDLPSEDLAKYSRALTNQVLQEMSKGLFQELHDRLALSPLHGPQVEFWTTPEARDRCLRIVDKIGGVAEKRRAHALFPSSIEEEKAEEEFWKNSRWPRQFVPLLPIRVYGSSSSPSPSSTPSSGFFKSLSTTSLHILSQGPSPTSTTHPTHHRATQTKTNPRLTTHTVRSMLYGAERGWTTLTANRTSVKAMVREMRLVVVVRGEGEGDGGDREEGKAAMWVVDPRSLAEGMRADCDGG